MGMAQIGRRLSKGAVLTGIAGTALLLTPLAAHAAVASWEGTLFPGQPKQCVAVKANSVAVATGTSRLDSDRTIPVSSRFTLHRDDILLVNTDTTDFNAGPYFKKGFYKLCVKNRDGNQVPVFASIELRSDNDVQ